MIDFEKERFEMVEYQIKGRGIKDERVIEAMRRIPRHMFVPESLISVAYGDHPVSIGEGQTISQPYIVALMTEALMLKGDEKALEIGTGSGYQTAVLAELCREVYTIERIPSLLKRAEGLLEKLGYKNIRFGIGDGTLGWKEYAPYDGIIVTAGAPDFPTPLIEQLSDNGRLVIPCGDEYSQILYRVTRKGNKFEEENLGGCRFVKLVGTYGWKE